MGCFTQCIQNLCKWHGSWYTEYILRIMSSAVVRIYAFHTSHFAQCIDADTYATHSKNYTMSYWWVLISVPNTLILSRELCKAILINIHTRYMQKFCVVVVVCRRFGLPKLRCVDVLCLSTFWFVDVVFCQCLGVPTFRFVGVWFVDVLVVAVSVYLRFDQFSSIQDASDSSAAQKTPMRISCWTWNTPTFQYLNVIRMRSMVTCLIIYSKGMSVDKNAPGRWINAKTISHRLIISYQVIFANIRYRKTHTRMGEATIGPPVKRFNTDDL